MAWEAWSTFIALKIIRAVLATHSAHAKKKQEHRAFLGLTESVKQLGIFPHNHVRVQHHAFVVAQLLECVQANVNLVSHPAAFDHSISGRFLNQPSPQVMNHALLLICASTTANRTMS